jgi:hypothetical protein
MHDTPPPEDGEEPLDALDALEELDPDEAARVRRRDHDLGAERRELMRPGMGKVFKQITDSWGEKASPHQDRARKGAGRGHDRPR